MADGKLEIIQTNFRHIQKSLQASKLLAKHNRTTVDGVLMDLGVSSHQINEPSRGFSFGRDGPLDMRMDKGQNCQNDSTSAATNSISALTVVNQYDVTKLADIFYNYGDEQRSRQIAREIVSSRPLSSTSQLEALISRMTSFKDRAQTLAKCFQALRIVVNDEIGALEEALLSMQHVVAPGGRLVIMSYHSLEDRPVKNLLKTGTVHALPEHDDSDRMFHVRQEIEKNNPWSSLTRKAIIPTQAEITLNRRSRSAKLRVAQRK